MLGLQKSENVWKNIFSAILTTVAMLCTITATTYKKDYGGITQCEKSWT